MIIFIKKLAMRFDCVNITTSQRTTQTMQAIATTLLKAMNRKELINY